MVVSLTEIAAVKESAKTTETVAARENAKVTEVAAVRENANATVAAKEIAIATEIVTETETVTMAENGKRTAVAEDRKPDHLPRLVIIADAESEKIIRNRSSKYKTLSGNRMRERKTVGMQSLPFYFCPRILVVQGIS